MRHLLWLATMLFFVPALAAQRLYTLYQEQRRLTDGLTQANEQLEKANRLLEKEVARRRG